MSYQKAARSLAIEGLRHSNEGCYEAAADAYSRALRHAPDNAALHNNLGSTYAKLGRYQEAIAALKRAIASIRNSLKHH